MPAINKPIVLSSGELMELLETSAMTSGAYVKARLVFKGDGPRFPSHIHPYQDETYEVVSGVLIYMLDGVKHTAAAGTTVHLPRNMAHQHWAEAPNDAVTIQTVSPGLDFDYVLETIFKLGHQGRGVRGLGAFVYGAVRQRRTKSTVLLADVPRWLQYTLSWIIAPVAELFGFRALKAFSSENESGAEK
jgi:quercetin dioxygenase-like cupin family protein